MHAVVAFVLALSASVQTPYDTVFEQIKGLAPQSNAVAPVHGLVLHRDVMELRLDDGLAYQLTPVAGRTTGIAFVGSGSFSFVPPLVVEQFNLKRVMGDSTINGPITAAVLIFTDSTQAELARSLKFGPAPQGATDPRGPIGDALEYITDGRSHSADPSLISALLNHTTTGYFTAFIQRKRGESVMIQIDPNEVEEVSLYRRGKMVGQRVETVCQFQRSEDLLGNVSVAAKEPEPLSVPAYDIDASIDGNYKFSARSTMRVVGRRDRQQWAMLRLYGELDVDSITAAGQPPTSRPAIGSANSQRTRRRSTSASLRSWRSTILASRPSLSTSIPKRIASSTSCFRIAAIPRKASAPTSPTASPSSRGCTARRCSTTTTRR